jgi:hypothetical protein
MKQMDSTVNSRTFVSNYWNNFFTDQLPLSGVQETVAIVQADADIVYVGTSHETLCGI